VTDPGSWGTDAGPDTSSATATGSTWCGCNAPRRISSAQWHATRCTLRLDTDLAHVIVDGALTRTTPLALTPAQRARLQGAQIAGPPPSPNRRPARTQRPVSARGDTQVIGQRVPVGLRHDGRIVTIEIGDTVLRVFDERGDTLINQTPGPAPKPWPGSRPTVTTATAQQARDRHPSTEAKPSRIIWNPAEPFRAVKDRD
jgi:hypothetical protein